MIKNYIHHLILKEIVLQKCFINIEYLLFMGKKGFNKNYFVNILFFLAGLSLGTIFIWPGIIKVENRNCFINILKDGSDGKVSIGTILSIEPSYLVKINNAETPYKKILLIGDQCFRK